MENKETSIDDQNFSKYSFVQINIDSRDNKDITNLSLSTLHNTNSSCRHQKLLKRKRLLSPISL